MHHPHMMQRWLVQTPTVYRYMDAQYVDDFFDSGRIRLSSFNRMRHHSDSERFDDSEGKIYLVAKTGDAGGQTLNGPGYFGTTAYTLCASLLYSEDLAKRFGNGCIQINDTTAFSRAIGASLPNFTAGLEGYCLYQEKKVIERDLGFIPIDINDPNRSEEIAKGALLRVAELNGYLLKPARYQHQQEYRLLWLTSHEVSDPIDIVCPEAVRFCQRPSTWAGPDFALDAPGLSLRPESGESIEPAIISEQNEKLRFPEHWRRRAALCFPPPTEELKNFSCLFQRQHLPDEVCDPVSPVNAQPDGGDLRFTTDREGTYPLPCHIIHFAHDSDHLARDATVKIRIKVRKLVPDHCATIWLWYNCAVTTQQPPADDPIGSQHAYDEHWQLKPGCANGSANEGE